MKKTKPVVVAITGISAIPESPASGLAIAYCLRKACGDALRIVGLGYDAFDAGLYLSDYCDSSYLIPYPKVGCEALFLRLKEIQEKEHIDVLIPCLDVELFLLTDLSDKLLSMGIKTLLPNKEQLKRCAKNRLAELAQLIGFKYPEIKTIENIRFFDTCYLEGWSYPFVVKGPFYDARIVSNIKSAIDAFNAIAADFGLPIIVQRYIKGEEYNLTAVVDIEGNMLGEVMMKKIALTEKGKGWIGVTVDEPLLLEAAHKLIKELQWRGPFELEVMRDANNAFHLIEINPRFPAWVSLSYGVGRNLPLLLLELILGKPPSSLSPLTAGKYFIRYAIDQIVNLNQIESMIVDGNKSLQNESEKGDKQKQWIKPSIVEQTPGFSNKFNAITQQFFAVMDDVKIMPLLKKYQSPLFIISEKTIRKNIQMLLNAFRNWPHVQHAWSYKTNYLTAVCNVFHQEGSWAEVVSEFEYLKARAAGVPGSRIIFNGPLKPKPALERAIVEGAMINIDHHDELYALEQLAKEMGKAVDVGIRLNFNTSFTEQWSRFGFNLENGEAMNVVQHIGSSEWLNLIGLHSHIGTFVLDTRAYEAQARTMASFMLEAEQQIGCNIKIINVGGGFASYNALKGIYLPPDQIVPTFAQYAEAIITGLNKVLNGRGINQSLPILVMETGRALIDNAEILVTRVVARKRLPDGRKAIVLDAGVNLLFTSFWYNHDIKPLRPLEGIAEETVLYGPLCMNVDVMRSSIMLPPLDVGEPLAISPAGAYNNTQWMQFIQCRPAIIMIMENGDVNVVRQAEHLGTFNEIEKVPPTLKNPFPPSTT